MAYSFQDFLFCSDGKGCARASEITRALPGGCSKAAAAGCASIVFFELYVTLTLKAIIPTLHPSWKI